MSLNLELKARIGSPEAAVALALRAGAREAGLLAQEDTYFQTPRGRLKLREIQGQPAELIYYERPDLMSERWSNYRKEHVANPAPLKEVLIAALGLLVVVRKQRRLFLTQDARIHIDNVEELGDFVEFEVTVPDMPRATEAMKELRELFQLEDDRLLIAGSYADLLLAERAGTGT